MHPSFRIPDLEELVEDEGNDMPGRLLPMLAPGWLCVMLSDHIVRALTCLPMGHTPLCLSACVATWC
jgi:hypothetical protein